MSEKIETRPLNILLGVSLIVAAALTISIQDVVYKFFSSELTLWQIFALQGVFRAALSKWAVLRAIFFTLTFLSYYGAIPFLNLSTVGAANYIAPIFITLLSAYAIKEAVGTLGWIGVLLGFTGVVVLLQPGSDAFSPWVLLPLIGAVFYALAHITTRTKCQTVPPAALSLSVSLMMMVAGAIVSVFLIWHNPQSEMAKSYPYIFGLWSSVSLIDWLVLLVLAGFTIVIGILLAGAYQAAPPAIVSTFEYSYLIFVAVWDILFFNSSPTVASVTGMVLIVVAGLLVLHRNVNNSQ